MVSILFGPLILALDRSNDTLHRCAESNGNTPNVWLKSLLLYTDLDVCKATSFYVSFKPTSVNLRTFLCLNSTTAKRRTPRQTNRFSAFENWKVLISTYMKSHIIGHQKKYIIYMCTSIRTNSGTNDRNSIKRYFTERCQLLILCSSNF
jgi:hypothetical protein